MKNKNNIILLLVLVLLISNGVLASEVNKSINVFGIKKRSSAEAAQIDVQKAVNKTVMKSQIASITTKINNTTSLYKSSVDNIIINLFPSEQLKNYNQEKQKIKNNSGIVSVLNSDIAEYGTLRLNRFLKSYEAKDSFQNLTIAQKYAIKKNLLNLKYVSGSYTQIIEQAKILTKQIKADKAAALELKADIVDLMKMQLVITKQEKSVNKLIDNLIKSSSDAG